MNIIKDNNIIYFKMNINNILSRFPNFELSYEKILHKKVRADIYSIIPSGKHAILWFTYYEAEPVAFILNINNHNEISSAQPFFLSFSKELSLGAGTILFGQVFNSHNMTNFACLDIYYYKGQKVKQQNFNFKFDFFNNIFNNEINSNVFIKNGLCVGLAISTSNFMEAIDIARSLPYNIDYIQLTNLNWNKSYGKLKYTGSSRVYAVLNIKAAIASDVYYLYTSDNYKHNKVAAIPDYKTSVILNSYFRNIKENHNLDLLEESDDEEEFENIDIDKYVDIKKQIPFICLYNSKFRKWQPIEVANKTKPVCCLKEIIELERKNTR